MLSSIELSLIENLERALDAIDVEWETIRSRHATEFSKMEFESFLYQLRALVRKLRNVTGNPVPNAPILAPAQKEQGTFEVDGIQATWNSYNLQVAAGNIVFTFSRRVWHRVIAKYITDNPDGKVCGGDKV